MRVFDICNDFNESLHGVRFIECLSYQESTVFTNLIFSLFAVISYGENILQTHLVRKCKKNIKYMNKKLEKVYSICSLKVGFQVKNILKNIKIQTKLFHVRFEILC